MGRLSGRAKMDPDVLNEERLLLRLLDSLHQSPQMSHLMQFRLAVQDLGAYHPDVASGPSLQRP
jgi:hypothetical protein